MRCVPGASPAPRWTCTTESRCLPITHCAACPTRLLTPHIGYATVETYRDYYGQAVEDIVAFGGKVHTSVLRRGLCGELGSPPMGITLESIDIHSTSRLQERGVSMGGVGSAAP